MDELVISVRVILMSSTTQENYIAKPAILENYKDLLSIKDLSEIFDVSKQTIYKEIQNGKFGKPIQIGRAFKIPKIYILQKYFYDY